MKGKKALEAFYTKLVASSDTRHARATQIVATDSKHAASSLHMEGTQADGEPYALDNMNLWEFKEGRVQSLRVYSGGVPNSPHPTKLEMSIPSGDRHVNATVCLPPKSESNTPSPLLIFAHGWLVAAEDYDYLCSLLTVDPKQQWVVALVQTKLEDPSVQPPLLEPLAEDAAFLARNLPSVPELAGSLNGQVVLGGHSLGGGTSVLAATTQTVNALALWAPGLYGATAADATKVPAGTPSLILQGSSDCVNDASLPLRAIDTYKKLGSTRKSIVMLKDANHCFFATPVKGSCGYDTCNAVPRLPLQATGLRIFQQFAIAALSVDGSAWSNFEQFLEKGKDEETGLEWESHSTSSGSGNLVPFSYALCPPQCCPAGLAAMGLCTSSAKNEL